MPVCSQQPKRYLVVGGWVWSRNDGDRHYVSAHRLVELYRVRQLECVLVEEREFGPGRIPAALLGVDGAALVELRPRADGDYRLPKIN